MLGDRSRTYSIKKRIPLDDEPRVSIDPDIERPRTRADCVDGMRPCPWAGCRHHLLLDVNPGSGFITFVRPDVDDMIETCALDVAARGGETLSTVGQIMNLTRERVRQLEERGLLRMRAAKVFVG